MPDRIQSFKVIAAGGLNTNQNFLELSEKSPGSAVRLVNFESSLSGGIRRIDGFIPYIADFEEVQDPLAPAEGPVLGVFGFNNNVTDSFQVYACRKLVAGAEYGYYLLTGTGWEIVATGVTLSSLGVSVVRSDVYHDGIQNHIIFVDGVNNAVVFDGSSWYQLDPANGGGSADPGGDQLLAAPAIVSVLKGYVFLSGDASTPGIMVYSAPNDIFTWTAAAGSGQQIANFLIQQIKPFRDELFVFGNTAIKKSVPDSAASWVFQDVTNNLGCTARDSVFELSGNLVYLSSDGLRVVAGTARIGDVELSAISNNIRNTLLDVAASHPMDSLRAVTIRSKSQFRYFLSNSETAVAASYGLIGSLQVRDNVAWEFGELLGIRTACTWSGFNLNNEEIIIHGDFNGCVYKQEEGSSFNGGNIVSVYTTPYLDLGDTEIRKTMRKLKTFVRAEGSFQVDIAVRFDWDDETSINPVNYTESSISAAAVYGVDYEYDGGATYGGPSQPVMNTNIQGSGFAVQFSYVSDGVYAPYTIQGSVIEFSSKGRQ